MREYLWLQDSEPKDYAVDVDPLCPGLESWGRKDSQGKRLINPLVRFIPIFVPLYERGDAAARAVLENLFFHLLVHDDRLLSLNEHELKCLKIRAEIIKGNYGQEARDFLYKFDDREQKSLLSVLVRQEENPAPYFLEALKVIFPASRVYYYRDDNKYLIYMPYREDEEAHRRLDLLEYLFCDVSCANKEYFWERPFAVIGEEPTLYIDEFVIYGSDEKNG